MHIITFDIEDWYNHDDYSRDFAWDKYEVRVYAGVEKILSALETHKIKGTFFCLGWLAEHHPSLIRMIADAGHQLACHSYQHELATRLSSQDFREDTYKAKCLIEDVGGKSVDAYRVPSFSVTRDNLWVFDILMDLGFKYDCSVFPARHEFGGLPDFFARPSKIVSRKRDGVLKEFPISLGRFLGREIVFSGGGYFRVIPYSILCRMTKYNDYVMSYFHPSDFDPDQPQMPYLPWMRQVKNRIALKGAYEKFKKYIGSDIHFINILEADSEVNWDECPVFDIDNGKS